METTFYEGGRVTAVKTTGVFCRPECPGKPKPENTEHFTNCAQALLAGYRACRRCFPLGKSADDGFNLAFQQLAGRPLGRLMGAPVVHVDRIETPLGAMIAAATLRHLVLLEFDDRRMMGTQFKRVAKAEACNFAQGENGVLAEVREQLGEFFEGSRRRFDIPMHTPGTDFQSRVWRELQRIPLGRTRSYADVARSVGQATAVRAVARANGDNRIAIIIPCHRVIGSDGSLTGYGGGLWRKARLLELEAASA